jgi:hypothetical protein
MEHWQAVIVPAPKHSVRDRAADRAPAYRARKTNTHGPAQLTLFTLQLTT